MFPHACYFNIFTHHEADQAEVDSVFQTRSQDHKNILLSFCSSQLCPEESVSPA